jgi:hypothetical protein
MKQEYTMHRFSTLLAFIVQSSGNTLRSPRDASTFRIIDVNEQGKEVLVRDEIGTLLHIDFWQFIVSIVYCDGDSIVPVDNCVSDDGTLSLEDHLRERFLKITDSAKGIPTAPIIADLLVLSGVAHLGRTKLSDGRWVLGVQMNP